MASSINLTDLQAAFEAFMIKYAGEFIPAIYQPQTTALLMRNIPNQVGEYRMTHAGLSEITQKYQKDWTPKGDLDFDPETIKATHLKFDLELDPDDLFSSYLAEVMTDETKTRDNYPFTRFLMEHIIQRLKEDQEARIALGSEVAIVPNTAGNNLDAYDGFVTKLADAISASKVTEIVTGAIVESTAYEQFKTLFDGIPEKYRMRDMIALCSPSVERMYREDHDATFGGNYAFVNPQTGEPRSGAFLRNTKTRLYGVPSMEGSGRVLVTPAWNLIRIYNLINAVQESNIEVQRDKRQLIVMGDFHEGVGFGTFKYVWCNDQA